MQLSVLGLSLQ